MQAPCQKDGKNKEVRNVLVTVRFPILCARVNKLLKDVC